MNGTIGLATLGGGVACEKFNDELTRVIENILDPNTEAISKRKIVLEITITPTPDRKLGAMMVASTCKLAATKSYATRAYFGQDKQGGFLAFEDDPNQLTFEEFAQSAQTKVVELSSQPKQEVK